MFVVANVNIDYKKAARFNDELDIETSIDKIGASRVDLTQNIMKNSDLYTSAKVNIACIHSETFKPQRIPKLIKQQMEIL
jgi:acyl-CoA thioester hydrolase